MKKRILTIILIALTLSLVLAVSAFAGEAEPEAELKIEAATLSFEDSVYLLYAVSHDGIAASDVRMLFWTEPMESLSDYTAGSERYSKSPSDMTATIGKKYCTVFKNNELRAKNMSDYVYARAYAKVDGVEYYSDVSKYSILQYAYNTLGYTAEPSGSEAFHNMLKSMLRYGADAQIYFGHSTERLANSDFYQINVVGGTLEDGFTKGLYTAGEVAALRADAPKDGEKFVGWTDGSGSLISDESTLLVDSFTKNETYTAAYESILDPGVISDAALPHYSYAESADGVYNSELFYQNSYDIHLGDPTVLPVVENGETWFYVTGTTGAIYELFKTKNFTDWYSSGSIFTPEDDFFGVESFWAPQLLYDPDASHEYYLGEEGEGKGLYILFFSARDENNVCKLAVAFSKTVDGQYKCFEGVNANGDYIDASNSLFEMEKLEGLGLYADHIYGDLYKANRSFIDASPFVDPISGDKYLYMVRSRNVDASNDVWGVKMTDWVTPDYSTTSPLTSHGYTDITKSEAFGYTSKNKIDEGPFLYYKDHTDDGIDNGKYYLTFSVGDTDDKLYPVCQAVGDTPLGPFTKVQPDRGGFVSIPDDAWDIHGTGHHAFFEVGGELYIAYHTYTVNAEAEVIKRYFAFNKVEWVEMGGEILMRANGPAKSILPLPSSASGYENVALGATTTAKDQSANMLTDGLVALRGGDVAEEFTFTSDTVITLSFEKWVSARAILIYNSYDYATAFDKIDRIEFSYRRVIDGKYYLGTAYIEDLAFNFDLNTVPEDYINAIGQSGTYLRPLGAAIAEFDEIEVNEIRIYIEANEKTAISEITVLGNRCESDSIPRGEGEIEADFAPYTAFDGENSTIVAGPDNTAAKIDGDISDPVWKEYATVTKIEGIKLTGEDLLTYGERSAEVYTYIDDNYVYFAFDVKDKNLFFNSAATQGQNTAVEVYFTAADNKILNSACYSVRVNPTGSSCNVGVYYGDQKQKEWVLFSVAPKVYCAAIVDGTVVTSKNEVSNPDNVGYTVEIAIDKSLVGIDANAMRYTAAFVQDRGYDTNVSRLDNTFIKGTKYIDPSTWVVEMKDAKVNDHGGFTMNNKYTDTYRHYDVELGKKDMTVAFNMDVPYLITNSDTVDIFTTTGRDSSQGFTFSIKRESATMWSARVKINGTTYWHRSISLHTYAGKSVSVAVEIDWAEDGNSVQVRVYYNGVENTTSGTYPMETDTGLDYNETSAPDHTPEKMLTFGSFNSSLNSADGGTVNSVANNAVKDYGIKINYIVIVEGLEGVNLFNIFS